MMVSDAIGEFLNHVVSKYPVLKYMLMYNDDVEQPDTESEVYVQRGRPNLRKQKQERTTLKANPSKSKCSFCDNCN